MKYLITIEQLPEGQRINVINVEDPEAFIASAPNYFARFDHVLLTDHEAGHPGPGWTYDAKAKTFTAPAEMVDGTRLEELAAEKEIAWETDKGTVTAKRTEDDAWSVRVPGGKRVVLEHAELIEAVKLSRKAQRRTFALASLTRDKAQDAAIRTKHTEARAARRKETP